MPGIAWVGVAGGLTQILILVFGGKETFPAYDGLVVSQVGIGLALVALLRLAGYGLCSLCGIFWALQGLQLIEVLFSKRRTPRFAWVLLVAVGLFVVLATASPSLARTMTGWVPVAGRLPSGPTRGSTLPSARLISGETVIITRCAPCFASRAEQSIRVRIKAGKELHVLALKGAPLQSVRDLNLAVTVITDDELEAVGMKPDDPPAWVVLDHGKVISRLGGE